MQTLIDSSTPPYSQVQRHGVIRTGAVATVSNDSVPCADGAYQFCKRAIDVFGAFSALICLCPLMLLVALAIKLETQGPVFFSQPRCGMYGRQFRFWKFRSMVVDAEAKQSGLASSPKLSGGVRFKMENDPRVTRVGRFIRKFSIDELPQLANVLAGDMSLVGPRPPLPSEVAKYSGYERQRLDALPGITCTWQIGGRSLVSFKEQVEMDLAYIASRSLCADLLILIRTPLAVITARGAC